MCIFINNVKFKIADQDIVCYKVLLKSKVDEGVFLSPYLRFYCTLNKQYDDNNKLDIRKLNTDFIINGGVFHMFANYEDAMDELNWLTFPENMDVLCSCAIVKCIIPKGSEYIEGKYIYFHSIASKSVIYKEVLYEKTPILV